MNHNSVSFSNLSPGDPATGTAYSDPANEYVSGTNDAAAQALRTNLRNPRSEIGTGLLEWMGRAFGDAVQRANYPVERLLQALPAAIYATDAVGRITFYNDAAAKLWGLPPRIRKQRVLRLLEALLARREADGSPPMSNGRSVERTARDTRHRGDGGAP